MEVMPMAAPDMRFDLNLKDADRRQALEDFFQQSGGAVVFDDMPSDNSLSVRAVDLSFRDAIELLLPEGFQAVEKDGLYHVRKVK